MYKMLQQGGMDLWRNFQVVGLVCWCDYDVRPSTLDGQVVPNLLSRVLNCKRGSIENWLAKSKLLMAAATTTAIPKLSCRLL